MGIFGSPSNITEYIILSINMNVYDNQLDLLAENYFTYYSLFVNNLCIVHAMNAQ